MIAGLLILVGLAGVIGAGLSLAARALPAGDGDAVERINAVLPQIQCGQCGYPGCRPYAAALFAGHAAINQCPPGGEATVRALAQLLDRPLRAPDSAYGTSRGLLVATIDEQRCTGCGCLAACPVDAILGAPRYMHTVLSADCTGCELCLPPCPVDCIRIESVDPEILTARHFVSKSHEPGLDL